MDRKKAIILYSNHSPASVQLLDYIQRLPVDFLTITGITLINIDNKIARRLATEKGIENVPILIIEYYDDSKHWYEDADIYTWINQIMKKIIPEEKPVSVIKQTPLPVEASNNDNKKRKKDLHALAAEMIKSRELDLGKPSLTSPLPV